MYVASVLSSLSNVDDAVDDAAARLEAQLGDHPDVLFVFASPRLRGRLRDVPRRASARLGSPLVCGCSGDGVLAEGVERERVPALAMMGIKLPDGARAQPLRAEAGAREINVGARSTGVVMLADPLSADVEAILRRFDASYRGVTMVGALASGAKSRGEHTLFLEGWTFHDGAVGVAFHGTLGIEAVVAQGCRPIGEPMIVTRADGPRILALDRGRPLDVLRELHATLGNEDRKLMRRSLLCGVQMRDSQIEYRPGDFLVREIVGIDEERGALVIAADLHGYPVVQLHVRDRRASAEDLHNALRRCDASDVQGALLFSCVGRGTQLYGEPDHDSRAVADHFGPLPLAGFFGNGEIGPVQGTTYVHGHTSAFGLLRVTNGRAARA